LVSEGLRLAGMGGLIAATGGCLPLAEKLPLLPVADALAELGRLEQGAVLEAALGRTPPYVRTEVARLLPQLGSAETGPVERAEPAERATWHAERARLEGAGDPGAWKTARWAWEELGNPHRAGYAWWRHAEVLLAAGRSAAAAAALQTAAAAAQTHAPLLGQVRTLAERAHIPIRVPSAPDPGAGPPAASGRYGLTNREAAVLRLLADGRTNAQIGAELFMSPKTASVHVTSIMRKLGVTSRVQAAAVAERAGLLHDELS
jgi:DNA-binding CsgD family transcriptional regulator